MPINSIPLKSIGYNGYFLILGYKSVNIRKKSFKVNHKKLIISTINLFSKSHLIFCRGIIRKNSIWDMIVFRKVQEGMGGRLRLMLVGSAPLAENVLTFVRCAMGCVVSISSVIYIK